MAAQSSGYDTSQFWPDVDPGATRDGVRCEDLTRLTFADASLDVFITQDVFEHVLDPAAVRGDRPRAAPRRAPRLHRAALPGPLYLVRARLDGDGGVEHPSRSDYHSNPVDLPACSPPPNGATTCPP